MSNITRIKNTKYAKVTVSQKKKFSTVLNVI